MRALYRASEENIILVNFLKEGLHKVSTSTFTTSFLLHLEIAISFLFNMRYAWYNLLHKTNFVFLLERVRDLAVKTVFHKVHKFKLLLW